jgi:hypothetical protein
MPKTPTTLPPCRRRRGDPERDVVSPTVEDTEVVDLGRLPDHLASELRARERTVLGHDPVHERLAAPVAEHLDEGIVDPAEAPFPVDHARGRGQFLHRPRKIRVDGHRFLCGIRFLQVEESKEALPVAPPRAAGRESSQMITRPDCAGL